MIEDFSFSLIVGICFVRVVMLPKSSADAIAPPPNSNDITYRANKNYKISHGTRKDCE